MRTQPFPALILLAFAASCASIHNVGNIVDPVSHGSGTPASPAATWTPPANAIPPRVPPPSDLVLPPAGAPLELAQIIDLALSNNPATRTTWLDARAHEQRHRDDAERAEPLARLLALRFRWKECCRRGGAADVDRVGVYAQSNDPECDP